VRNGGEGEGLALVDWRVRWRTVIVWSWAVTSLRFLGRLGFELEAAHTRYLRSSLFLNPWLKPIVLFWRRCLR
jgi:hypothetical protein